MHIAAGPDDLVGDLCPGCGSLLKPVGDLAEIVGFRSIRSRDGSADDTRRARTSGSPVASRTSSPAARRFSPGRSLTDWGSMTVAVSAPTRWPSR